MKAAWLLGVAALAMQWRSHGWGASAVAFVLFAIIVGVTAWPLRRLRGTDA